MPRSSRGSFRRGFPVSARRKTSWTVGPSGTIVGLAAAGSTLFTTGAQSTVDGLTMVRTRGELQAHLTDTTAAGDGFPRIACGLCVVAENAFDAGVASVPAPLTDISWDGWLWHRLFGLVSNEAIGPSAISHAVNTDLSTFRTEIDSKAMRKLKGSDVVIAVFETGAEVGTAVMDVSINTRILSKLS